MSIEYLVEKYSKLVYKICYDMLSNSLDAEDITQEVYLSLYANLYRYNTLSENELKNIICKIALNKCRDILKGKMKKIERMTTDDILSLENYIDGDSIEEQVIKNEGEEQIKQWIMQLKEPYKDILYDYYIKEESLDQIADKMNVTKGTLKMQIYRAKKILKTVIEKSGGVELL